MDTLQNVFPLVPQEALERVLDICDQSVEAASEWLLENDWHDLMDGEGEQDDGEVEFVGETTVAANGAGHGDALDEHTQNGGESSRATGPQIAGSEQQNGHGVAVAAAAATRNYIARALSASNAVSPGSNHSEQSGLTMAVSTGSVSSRAANGLYGGAHNAGGGTGHQRTHLHHPDRLGRHHRREDDMDREYDSGGELDSEDGEGEGEEDEDEEDEEDDDDEDDEDGDANSYYDSGDDSYYHGSMPQLTKRVKVTRDPTLTNLESNEYFWVSFDGQIIPKTLIELLNTTLTKLAHNSVTLLNKSSKHMTEEEARRLLKSILKHEDEAVPQQHVSGVESRIRSGSLLSRILHVSTPGASSSDPTHAGQKRKRADDLTSISPRGFFAYFFSISDLDMVWRSILHAHLLNRRFGEVVEFHTSASGGFSKRDFDELMHAYTTISSSSRSLSFGASPLSGIRCCLLLPCEASENEIFRVGKHLHTLLKIQGSLYYRTLDVTLDEGATSNRDNNPVHLLNEDGKLSEESFRRFARYRIKKEEVDGNEKSEKEALGPDHFLAYQQQRKVDHCLQHLEKNAWVQRLSG